MPVKLDDHGVIANADELTANDVVRRRVLCPGCGAFVFRSWPGGSDAHAARRCRMTAATAEGRVLEFRARFGHLFGPSVPSEIEAEGQASLPTIDGLSFAVPAGIARKVWQISAGDAMHDCADLFEQHDVMFMGPGRYGPYDRARYRAVVDSGAFSAAKVGAVRAFSEEVQPGDVVLMRRGAHVRAIGIVPSGADGLYKHRPLFDDIYGWDLEHSRRVVWQDHLQSDVAALQSDGPPFGTMTMAPTFTQVNNPDVLVRIEPLVERCEMRPLRQLPPDLPAPMSPDDFGEALFEAGLSNAAADGVVAAIRRQRRLLRWYETHGSASGRPTEHEVVAHMVLPMLLALGWSEQLLAVEWKRVDLAAFSGVPTVEAQCVMICEAKGVTNSLTDVVQQALRYIAKLELSECRTALVSQGGRFLVYAVSQELYDSMRSGGEWQIPPPSGYLNVEKLRTEHLAPAGTSAVRTLLDLAPLRARV